MSTIPAASLNSWVRARSAEGATVGAPAGLLWWLATRPTCISCRTMRPPAACTAWVTLRQAAICAAL